MIRGFMQMAGILAVLAIASVIAQDISRADSRRISAYADHIQNCRTCQESGILPEELAEPAQPIPCRNCDATDLDD